jgi:hypothetical protein
MKKFFVLSGLAFVVFLTLGCTRTVVIRDRPPMPEPKVEVRTAMPYRNAVWAGGHWEYRKRCNCYVWIGGHWRRP